MKNPISAIVGAAFCMLAAPVSAQQATDTGSVEQATSPTWKGIWVAERIFQPELSGPLTLQKSADTWIAHIQGDRVSANRKVAEDGSISWSFSFFDLGHFEGQQASPNVPLEGHWFQPADEINYSPVATPVRLSPTGQNAFNGELRPVPGSLTLNIPMIPEDGSGDDGPYRTFLRNPERNTGNYFRIETATVDGDKIRFANGDGEIIGTGQIIEEGERFTLPHRGAIYEFTLGTRQTASGFYARRSPEAYDHLLKPIETGDGWSTATLSEAGIDEAPILELINLAAAYAPRDLGSPYIHSLLIAHEGKLVMEEYFNGHHRDKPHDSRSAGKSLTSALLGIAIQQGMLASVDEPVYPFFGGVEAFANPDPRKNLMTARHLISMTSGLDCDDGDQSSPGNEDTMQSQEEQPDWYRYILDLAMVREPGAEGAYCTGGINLAGGMISKASGMSLPHFFYEHFAKPLDISYYQMNLSPDYKGYMGGGIQLRPRDFLKLGQLYLNEGVWNGKRIVSEDWVHASSAAQTSINGTDNYGFAWWRRTLEVEGQNIESYFATGNGGQVMFIVPELETVILLNAGNYGDGLLGFLTREMQEIILPAVMADD